jgi:hypothetical protein
LNKVWVTFHFTTKVREGTTEQTLKVDLITTKGHFENRMVWIKCRVVITKVTGVVGTDGNTAVFILIKLKGGRAILA